MVLVVVMWMCFVLGDLGFVRSFGSFCCRLCFVDTSGRTSVLSAGSRRCVCVCVFWLSTSIPLALLGDHLFQFAFLLKCRNMTQVIFLDELVKRGFNSLSFQDESLIFRDGPVEIRTSGNSI